MINKKNILNLNMKMNPFTLAVLFFFIQTHSFCQATVPANETFKYVNEGELGQYISEYLGDYRALDVFTSPFQLCFYNQTPTAFTLSLRMGLRRTESPMRWVWEANRGKPVDENATFSFGTDGNLVLARSNGQVAWQSGTANKSVVGLKVLPTGNMVLYDSKGKFLWQSFDSPTDTLLVGQSLRVGATTKLVSRASQDENVNGPYSLVMEPTGLTMYYTPSNSSRPMPYFTFSQWFNITQGTTLENVTMVSENNYDQGFAYSLYFRLGVANSEYGGGATFSTIKYNTTLSFLRLEMDGNIKIYTYNDKVDIGPWEVTYTLFARDSDASECQLPSRCGTFGLCEDSQCIGCPSPNGTALAWSKSCEAPKISSCAAKDFHYSKQEGVDHFMTQYSNGDGPVKESDCELKCTRDCKCLGYFYHQDTSKCWIAYDLKTLTRVDNIKHLGFLKVAN